MWFLAAAAGIGVLFAAAGLLVMAALERGRDHTRIAALRSQGLPAGVVHGAALASRWTLVVVGGLAGLLAAAGSWLLAHRVVPIFADGVGAVPTRCLPGPMPVLVPVGIALLALLLMCVPATRLAAGARGEVDL
jgi:hypothetical protein